MVRAGARGLILASARYLCHQYIVMSISAGTNKRGRPRTTGKGVQIGVRLQPAQLAALDHWIAAQPEPVTRPEAVRQLLAGALNPHQA